MLRKKHAAEKKGDDVETLYSMLFGTKIKIRNKTYQYIAED